MFEAAELGRKISKEEYKKQVPSLRTELIELQQEVKNERIPALVVFAGVDGAGKSETVNLLHEWMDPRWLVTRAFGEPSDEELERPPYWRFWRELPPHGRLGLFLSSWYSQPILDRVYRRSSPAEFDRQLDRIAAFERMLTEDGTLILKFWMHLSKSALRDRLKTLEKNRLTRWRITKIQWTHFRMYGRFIAAAERAIRRTSTASAPWLIVEGRDEEYRSLTVGTFLRDGLRRHLSDTVASRKLAKRAAPTASARQGAATTLLRRLRREQSILARLDMTKAIPKKKFDLELERFQGRLNLLHRKAAARGRSTIMVLEGWDAAGKGGAIRRVTAALDARSYQVIPIAAPTDEERAHHYLWRFWRHLARAGRVTIFDRSWYGRVLVERVEGFAALREWLRAYSEINEFEEQLAEHGVVLAKYWIHVTKEEQERRFREREKSSFKNWKLTEEDWRNRRKWNDYELAVNDMVERTSTRHAPWTMVEGNDKLYARIKVIRTLCDRLEGVLD
jgi:polyphosphate:AMP phosphotransferase